MYMAEKYLRSVSEGRRGGQPAGGQPEVGMRSLKKIRRYVHVVLKHDGVGGGRGGVKHLAEGPSVMPGDFLVVGVAAGGVLQAQNRGEFGLKQARDVGVGAVLRDDDAEGGGEEGGELGQRLAEVGCAAACDNEDRDGVSWGGGEGGSGRGRGGGEGDSWRGKGSWLSWWWRRQLDKKLLRL